MSTILTPTSRVCAVIARTDDKRATVRAALGWPVTVSNVLGRIPSSTDWLATDMSVERAVSDLRWDTDASAAGVALIRPIGEDDNEDAPGRHPADAAGIAADVLASLEWCPLAPQDAAIQAEVVSRIVLLVARIVESRLADLRSVAQEV